MSHDSDTEKNLDYATGGASVFDVHDSVRRERSEPETENVPVSIDTFLLAAGILILGALLFGWHTEWGSMSTIYNTASYSPEPAPAIGGVIEEEDAGPWIDTWMAGGKKVYANCVACHQPNGGGAPGQFPPLVDVDYVNEGTERLAAILLHGINGPLTVNGVTYNQAMPAWAVLGDEKIAQVMTYIRAEFGKLPPEEAVVTTAMMNAAREKFSDRTTTWTEAELKKLSPDADLPGGNVDLQTGTPAGGDAAAAPDAETPTE